MTRPPPIVLCVDDEPAILRSLARTLRNEGYTLLTAGSGEEALEVLSSRGVDLIIADHRMPGISGAELLEEVAGRWPATTRVMLSGFAEASQEPDAPRLYHRFLAKPWHNTELRETLRALLSRAPEEAARAEGQAVKEREGDTR